MCLKSSAFSASRSPRLVTAARLSRLARSGDTDGFIVVNSFPLLVNHRRRAARWDSNRSGDRASINHSSTQKDGCAFCMR